MFATIKSFLQPRAILSFSLVAGTGLLSFASTKLAFAKFQEPGLISLGDALNIIGIVVVLSSLSIESGLVRKLILLKKDNSIFLKSALIILYLLGATLGITYILLMVPSASKYFIYITILYFPFSVLRSYLIANGLQHISTVFMLTISASTLFSVAFSTSPHQIFNLIILVQFVFIAMLLILSSYILRRSISPLNLVRHIFDRNTFRANLTTSTELLRFSFHSIASGFQNNQAMLASRLFLVTFVGVEFAGEMEMYQRPLTWLFVLASTMASLFFYPFVVDKIKDDVVHPLKSKVQLEIFSKVVVYGSVFIGILMICFPFLFWLTFGYNAILSPTLAAFWIAVFSLRFFGVLLSSWLLAKNNVRGAMIAEMILYLPLILVFGVIPGVHTFGIEQVSIYLAVVGFSSLLYLVYFIFILKLHLIFARAW